MGTFYNSRLLEWMEVGRTELIRAMGCPYSEWEARGVMAPIVEAGLQFRGRAGYDDLLRIETCCSKAGRVRLRFDSKIVLAETGGVVAEGFTIHALVNAKGKPLRIPDWIEDLLI
jgi:acyl-CoA thioester hydrolase